MIGITDKERKAFMTGMVSEQTADIKGEYDEEFIAEKVIKMHIKRGGQIFLWNGLGILWVMLVGNHLKIVLKNKHVSIKSFLFVQS